MADTEKNYEDYAEFTDKPEFVWSNLPKIELTPVSKKREVVVVES
jgi:hypothetical protein